MTTRAVLFDFDGVLADTEGLHLRAFQDVLAPSGVALEEAAYNERYLGYTDYGLLEALSRDRELGWGAAEIDAIVIRKGAAFRRLMDAGGLLYPAAPACIERLAVTHALAIASGAFREEIEFVLGRAGLAGRFQAIVGAGDVASGKPAPDPYLEAARRIGVPPQFCVAIEDSVWGLESARRAGCRTIAVTHTYARDQLAADAIVASLDEITADLLNSCQDK